MRDQREQLGHQLEKMMVELGIRPLEWAKVSEENKTSRTLASNPPADWQLRKKTICAWRKHAMPYCSAFAINAQESPVHKRLLQSPTMLVHTRLLESATMNILFLHKSSVAYELTHIYGHTMQHHICTYWEGRGALTPIHVLTSCQIAQTYTFASMHMQTQQSIYIYKCSPT